LEVEVMGWSKATKLLMCGVGLATALFGGTALAKFPRNVSGIWRAPNIGTVTVVHDPDSETASFTMAIVDPRLPDGVVFTFSGRLYHSGVGPYSGATHFSFFGSAPPYAFRRGVLTCDVEYPGFQLSGTLLGQLGSREIDASYCGYNWQVSCKSNGTVKDMFMVGADCNGTWE
jgi:hypothetical protein